MKLVACLIVKDDSEHENLVGALVSVVPYVNEVYVTATGEDVDGIESTCKELKVNYSYFKWNDDFSAARNFNFSQAPINTDYIFWMDSDDRIVGGQHLREIAQLGKNNGKDVIFLEYWYACRFKGEPSVENIDQVELVHQRERLIRPGSIHWVGRLHETPMPIEGSKHVYTSCPFKPYNPEKLEFPIAVAHMAEGGDHLLEKMARNKRILELQLAEERKRDVGADPRTLLYLMKIYAELDEPELLDECLVMGQEYLKKSGWDEERGTCYELMGQVYGKKGDFHKAKDCFLNAIGQWPHNVLLYVRLASTCYNLKDYNGTRHWMEVGSKIDMDKRFTAGMVNFHAIKAMFAELLLKMNYHVDKDIRKAFEASKMLYQENPCKETLGQMELLESMVRMDDACKNLDEFTKYLHDIGNEHQIVPILDSVPDVIQDMPFAQNLRKKFSEGRKWDDNEICYFANFNQPHFSKWDTSSLETGIGGSETAVIMLAQEWAKLGYRVTIYGDPVRKGDHTPKGAMGRVIYLPYYHFNIKDKFNVFIQWRGWQLAQMIKCKRFYVDLHDIISSVNLSPNQLNNIDKLLVKSQYQRDLLPTVEDSKFLVIPHGL